MQTQQAQIAPSAGKPAAAEPQLQAIPPTHVADVWPLITDHIESVVTRSRGRYSRKGVAERLIKGEWQLWLVWDGAIKGVLATELYFDVSGTKTCGMRFCTGANLRDWIHLLSTIENWARSEGCTLMSFQMRKGAAKHLPDYKMAFVVLEKAL